MRQTQLDTLPSESGPESVVLDELSTSTGYINKRHLLERFREQLEKCAVSERGWRQVDQPAKDSAAPRRILIVDDEEVVALGLQEGLKRLPNCEVAVVTSGEEALQLFEQQPFDLLITDYKMPGIDGMTLATHIRQLHPQMPIIMITAHASDALRERAARVPIQRVLDKPVELTEIRSAVLGELDG